MSHHVYESVLKTIHQPYGIFITTGPTGSGKTTTLYSCINKIRSPEKKIITAEDPVEFEIDGIQQLNVNEALGLSFSKVLRHFLRHDPDYILIGETRDFETAQIAVQASLTGHLVLTSLHTNDSASAITRLIDMGIDPFLISSSLNSILSQRLIRKICNNCKESYTTDNNIPKKLNINNHDFEILHHGTGCESCLQTGYKGRLGVFEFLPVTEPIKHLIDNKTSAAVIKNKAIELGMEPLRYQLIKYCLDGTTSFEEITNYL
jgi:type IV pilus assembly protein PilB